MKNLLYKFDRTPVFVRVFILLILSVGLVTGYLYANKQLQVNHSKVEAARLKLREERAAKEAEEEAAKEAQEAEKVAQENKQQAEEAVAKLEAEASVENLNQAKEAVAKVTEEDLKQGLEGRIQAIEARIQPVPVATNATGTGTQLVNQPVEYIVVE